MQDQGEGSILLHRKLYTFEEFEKHYRHKPTDTPRIVERFTSRLYCSSKRVWKFIIAILPILGVLRKYRWRKWFVMDMLAGLTAGIMHIPQGMSYGYLAGLQPVYGLYTSFFSVVVYVVFGTSQHLSFGVDAVTSIVAGGIINMELENMPITSMSNITTENGTIITIYGDGLTELEYRANIAAATSFTVGCMLFGMGLLRLGFITTYLSDSFISGFTTGAAVHIATSQAPKMLGLSIGLIPSFGKVVRTYIAIFQKISSVNVSEVLISLVCAAILLFVKIGINERYKAKLKIPLPIDLIVVILGTVASYFGKFHEKYDVNVVHDIPAGIPTPSVPGLDKITPSTFILECFILAILIFAVSISMAKLCAKKSGVEIDDNQELLAYGMCNALSSFFHCFPSSCGSPRTMLLSTMGAKSTLTGLSSAALILLVLMVIGHLFQALPICILAAMIVVAMKNLFLQVRDLRIYWRVNIFDCITWLATFFSVVFLNIDIGLGVGVVVSAFTVVFQSQVAGGRILGKTKDEDIATDIDKEHVHSIPGVKIFKFDTSFFYANAEILRKKLFKSTVDPKCVLKKLKAERKASNQVIPAPSDKKEHPPIQIVSDVGNLYGGYPDIGQIHDKYPAIGPQNGEYPDLEQLSGGYLVVGQPNGGYLDMGHVNEGFVEVGHMGGSLLNTLENHKVGLGGNNILFQRDRDNVRQIILDCSCVTYIDITGINMLKQIFGEYKIAKIVVLLAGCQPGMIRALEGAEFFTDISRGVCFYSVTDAIKASMIDRCEAVQSVVTKL